MKLLSDIEYAVNSSKFSV